MVCTRRTWLRHATLRKQRHHSFMIMPPLQGGILTCCQLQSHGNKQAAGEAPPGGLRRSRRHRCESTQRPVISIFHCQRSASHLSMAARRARGGGGTRGGSGRWTLQEKSRVRFFFWLKKAWCEMSQLLCPLLQGQEKWIVSAPSHIQPEDAFSCINNRKKRKQHHKEQEISFTFGENYHLEVENFFTKERCCSPDMVTLTILWLFLHRSQYCGDWVPSISDVKKKRNWPKADGSFWLCGLIAG